MSIYKYCFLDMDGVLVDFVGGVCKAHGRTSPYANTKAYGIWDMEKLWGISVDEFYKPTEYRGFWLGLEKTPDADDIVKLVLKKYYPANIAILSAPSKNKYCIPEKREWLEKYYPELAKNTIFTSDKRFLAGRNRVLIDDRDKNCTDFFDAGGRGLLIPRLWNQLWYKADSSLDYLKEVF